MKVYEKDHIEIINSNVYLVRLDGCNFSKFTKPLQKPFDENFVKAMANTAADLLTKFNAKTVYCHSDEFSVIINEEIPLFGGKNTKILSKMASYCSVLFNYHMKALINEHTELYTPAFVELVNECKQTFDARILTFRDQSFEIVNHMYWRSVYDCHRNAVSTYARQYYSARKTMHKHSGQLIEMLAEQNVDWEKVPIHLKYGSYFKREIYEKQSDTQEPCIRTRVVEKNFKISFSKEMEKMLLAKYW
jgi:tRNA(His) 5'-end guanylyltransferase